MNYGTTTGTTREAQSIPATRPARCTTKRPGIHPPAAGTLPSPLRLPRAQCCLPAKQPQLRDINNCGRSMACRRRSRLSARGVILAEGRRALGRRVLLGLA